MYWVVTKYSVQEITAERTVTILYDDDDHDCRAPKI